MNFFNRIFGKKEPVLTFEQQIQEEIFQCETSIFDYEKDIHKIRGWAIDLIHKTFEVPKELWYEELDNLYKIRDLSQNKKVSKEAAQDTIKIALSYKQQIELRKMKVEACKKNIIQLRQIIKNKKRINKELTIENSQDLYLENHKKKANSLQNNNISSELLQNEKVKALKNQIDELEEQLKLKKETNKQLKILHRKYGESLDYETTKVYLDELKNLLMNNH